MARPREDGCRRELFRDVSVDGASAKQRILWALLFHSRARQKALWLIIFCWWSDLCRLRINIKHDPLSSKTWWYSSGMFAENSKRWIMLQGQFLESVGIHSFICPTRNLPLRRLFYLLAILAPLRLSFSGVPLQGDLPADPAKIATMLFPYSVFLECFWLRPRWFAPLTVCVFTPRQWQQKPCGCFCS